MVGAVCISVYKRHGGRTARQEGMEYTRVRYTIYKHSIQPPSPELRNARVRVSRVRARVCVRYIIILLYYYNIIIFIYTQYTQYIQYTQYT